MSLDERIENWMKRPIVGLPLRMLIDERWHRRLALVGLTGFIADMVGRAKHVNWLMTAGRVIWYPAAAFLISNFVLMLLVLVFFSPKKK